MDIELFQMLAVSYGVYCDSCGVLLAECPGLSVLLDIILLTGYLLPSPTTPPKPPTPISTTLDIIAMPVKPPKIQHDKLTAMIRPYL